MRSLGINDFKHLMVGFKDLKTETTSSSLWLAANQEMLMRRLLLLGKRGLLYLYMAIPQRMYGMRMKLVVLFQALPDKTLADGKKTC